MPWQNNEDGEDSGRKGGSGKPRNPWGGKNDDTGKGEPRNPWGQPSEPRDSRPRAGGGNPDFDEFIRRSQERLRKIGSGNSGGGGGGQGGGRRNPGMPTLPWGMLAGGAALILIAVTSAYQVGPGERGVVTRLGKYSSTSGPGFHLKLPAPIDQVIKVNYEDIRTTLIGSIDGENENLMITGDGNVISIAYAVRWRVKNAEDFLFQIANPEATVRDATESAMRETIGRSTLDNAIGPERAEIAEQVRERVQEILDSYGAGIMVQGLDINKADPPAAVDEAFKDVSAAQQDVEQFMNQARAYAQQIQAQAAGATAAFDKVYAEYRLAPEVTRKRMYLETMENVLTKVDTTVIEAPGVQTYLPLTEVQSRMRAAQQQQAQEPAK